MKFQDLFSILYGKFTKLLLGMQGDQFIRQAYRFQQAQNKLGVFDDRYIRRVENAYWTEIQKAQISTKAKNKFAELEETNGLQIELGGGAKKVRDGWINIDLIIPDLEEDLRDKNGCLSFINYDLRLGLPLRNGSCAFIYSSHFFEHLEYVEAINLLQDCHRCLEQNGHLRLALPDYRNFLIAYLNGDYKYFRAIERTRFTPGVEKGRETLADFLSLAIYERGEHKYIYDLEKLMSLLDSIGFSKVAESAYVNGIDLKARRHSSFYIEAVK